MVFFISKENKTITTIIGVLGLIGLTIGIALSLLLYQFTYGHPELRIPSMAIVLFLGMYLSRVLVLGPLAFLLGFVIAVTQSIGDLLPSPELVVRAILWIWVALAYAVGLTVVLNRLFLPKPTGPPKHLPKPKGLFVPDAFTNPAHVRFALKVTLAAMFCYVLYSAIDWFGIHTAFITCVFIALESTGRTLHKGVLRAVGCIIGGLLALFSIIFLIPHMEIDRFAWSSWSRASRRSPDGSPPEPNESLTPVCRWPLPSFTASFRAFRDSRRARTSMRFAIVSSAFSLGLMVTALVFQYIWPERAIDRLRDTLREVLGQLAKLLVIPSPEIPVKEAKPKAEALIAEISRELEKARREAEGASFEIDEPGPRERVSLGHLETLRFRAEHVLALATSLTSDSAWQEWQQMPPDAQEAESELRNAIAKRVERAANGDSAEDTDANLSSALTRWTETIQRLSLEASRVALVPQITAEARHLG